MQCPGQDTRYWSGDAVFEAPCPKCGESVEFFKDDSQRRCGNCGHRFPNPRLDFGCAAYCPFAAQCLGAMPEEMRAKREEMLRERLLTAVREHFSADGASWPLAERSSTLAVEIAAGEGVAQAVVLAGALLHDVSAESARALLDQLKADAVLRETVLALRTAPPAGERTAVEWQVVLDARDIVVLAGQWRSTPPTSSVCDQALAALRTMTGREIARREWQLWSSH